MKNKIIILLLLSFFIQTGNLYAWELKKDEKGVQVYNRNIAGTDIKELKTVAISNYNYKTVLKVLTNVKTYTKWWENCIEAKELKFISNTKRHVNFTTRSPWPLKNRDVVLYMLVSQTNSSYLISFMSEPDFIKHDPDKVRVKNFKSKCKIIKLSENQTKIEYIQFGDAGGNVPVFLMNLGAVKQQYNTMYNLVNFIKKINSKH